MILTFLPFVSGLDVEYYNIIYSYLLVPSNELKHADADRLAFTIQIEINMNNTHTPFINYVLENSVHDNIKMCITDTINKLKRLHEQNNINKNIMPK